MVGASSVFTRPAALGSGLGLRARDDRLEIAARRERAVLEAALAAEARGAEGVGDGGIAVADQQRALQPQSHPFAHAAAPYLERLGVGELPLQLRHARVEARVAAGSLLDLVQVHL